ncbi:MAG: hypothetical protein ACP5G2_07625 [Candidatus Bipolaricaulaceae bacterium]
MTEPRPVERVEEELGRLRDCYRRAVEQALARVPAHNGVVTVQDLWLETSLPPDLVAEVLRDNGVRLPPHVNRVDLSPPKGERKGRRGKRS